MSNVNTVAGFAQSGTLRNQFPAQVVATATETALTISTDGTAAAYLLTLPTALASGTAYGSQTPYDVNSNASSLRRSGREYGLPSGESNDQFIQTATFGWDGRPFKIRLSGVATLGATQTAIFYLYCGATTVVGTAGNRIALTGAAYPSGGTTLTPSNFLIEFTGVWDATSQILSGWYTADIANGTTSQFVTTTVITNVQTAVAATGLTFCAGVKLANTTSSTIQLREFVAEKL